MEYKKALSIFSTFSSINFNQFHKFLRSPYHNESKNVLKLYELIKEDLQNGEHKILDSLFLHKKIFKSELHGNIKSVNNLFTALIKLAELYIEVEILKSDKIISTKLLVEYYLKKNSRLLFNKTAEKLYNMISPDIKYEPDNLVTLHKLKKLNQEYMIKDIYSGVKKFSPLYISSKTKHITEYFCYCVCMEYIEFLMYSSISEINSEIIEEKENYVYIINNIPLKNRTDTINLLIDFISIYTSDKKPDFIELNRKLTDKELQLSDKDRAFLMKVLFQYGKMICDSGIKSITNELIILLKFITRSNLWLNSYGKISEHAFNAVCRFMSEESEFEWVEKFIDEYYMYIDSDEKQNIVNYNTAVYYFYKTRFQKPYFAEDFDVALNYLSKVSSRYSYKKLAIYRLLMMIYFETGQVDSLYYQYDSIMHYLNEHRIDLNEKVYLSNLNFSKYLCELSHIKDKYFDEFVYGRTLKLKNQIIQKFSLLEKELNNCKICEDKKWLIQVLKENMQSI